LLLSEVRRQADHRDVSFILSGTVLPACSAQRVVHGNWTLQSLLLSLVLVFASTSALAQPSDYEPVLGFRLNLNQSKAGEGIQTFSGGTQVCGTYTSGDALKPSFFVGLRMPEVFGLRFTPFVEYRDLSSTFTLTPDKSVHIANVSLDRELVTFERRFETKLSALYLGSEIELLNLFGFGIGISPSFGIPLANSYSESESITSDNAFYLPSLTSTIETRPAGSFTSSSVLADLGITLSTSFRLKNGVTIGPSIRTSIPLVGVANDQQIASWKVSAMSAGVSLGYDPIEKLDEPVIEPVLAAKEPAPIIRPKRSILTATISAVGVNNDGSQIAEPTLTVERLQVTEAIPTLNYVFFKSGEAELDARYNRLVSGEETMGFDERTLFAMNAEQVHHQILNIIGARLQADQQARITLVGTRSVTGESQTDLGSARAESIARYLRDVWGIASNRIKIQPRQLPENASDDQTAHGQEENQRVEIIPSKPSIVAPLWASRIERVATPPRILFEPEITADADVASATIYVRQGDNILQTFDALNGGSVGEHLWRLSESSMPTGEDSLVYDLVVRDVEGNEARSSGSIKLRHVRRDVTEYRKDSLAPDRKVEKFSLILFDYSSSELAKNQADTIINYVAKSIAPNTRLIITGHTDKTGNDTFNEQLAGQRATRAAELLDKKLRALKKSRPDMSVESHGSRDILFDNSVPEGRFLSRTVRVTVEEVAR
jgi:outer membrane protein OmpA-like peptidoglycan-associated protein